MSDIELAQGVLAKLCHDLAGPMGAIWGSVEYLENSSENIRQKAVNLINSSANQAITRLKFFRYAYSAITHAEEHSLQQIVEFGSEFLENTGLSVKSHEEVTIGTNTNSENINGNLIACMIVVASDSLPKGGEIFIQSTSKEIAITCSGSKLKLDGLKSEILLGKSVEEVFSVGNIHHYYTMRLIEQCNFNIDIEHSSNSVIYRLTNKI